MQEDILSRPTLSFPNKKSAISFMEGVVRMLSSNESPDYVFSIRFPIPEPLFFPSGIEGKPFRHKPMKIFEINWER